MCDQCRRDKRGALIMRLNITPTEYWMLRIASAQLARPLVEYVIERPEVPAKLREISYFLIFPKVADVVFSNALVGYAHLKASARRG